MENLRNELEALKAIEAIPMPPRLVPIPSSIVGEDTVKMPFEVSQYLDQVGAKYSLDKEGKLPAWEYTNLLDTHGVPANGMPRFIKFKVISKTNNS